MKLFYYRYRGGGLDALGPVRARSLKEAREQIRGEAKRLPAGTEVWETTRKAMKYITDNNRHMARESGRPLD